MRVRQPRLLCHNFIYLFIYLLIYFNPASRLAGSKRQVMWTSTQPTREKITRRVTVPCVGETRKLVSDHGAYSSPHHAKKKKKKAKQSMRPLGGCYFLCHCSVFPGLHLVLHQFTQLPFHPCPPPASHPLISFEGTVTEVQTSGRPAGTALDPSANANVLQRNR